jgi:hypothetical protein
MMVRMLMLMMMMTRLSRTGHERTEERACICSLGPLLVKEKRTERIRTRIEKESRKIFGHAGPSFQSERQTRPRKLLVPPLHFPSSLLWEEKKRRRRKKIPRTGGRTRYFECSPLVP